MAESPKSGSDLYGPPRRCVHCGASPAPLADPLGAACARCAYTIDVLGERPISPAADDQEASRG